MPRRPVIWLAGAAAVCAMINLLCIYVNDSHMAYSFAYTIVVQFLVSILLFKGDQYCKLYYILFSNVYYACIQMITIFIQTMVFPDQTMISMHVYTVIVNILPQTAAILSLIPLQRHTLRSEAYLSLPGLNWVFIYSIYLAVYFGIIYITDTLVGKNLVSGFSVLLLMVLLLAVWSL